MSNNLEEEIRILQRDIARLKSKSILHLEIIRYWQDLYFSKFRTPDSIIDNVERKLEEL